ncbi:MAG: hypothetical protein JW760_01395 [Spirochaetales bacterium]|nr:hypothetical protein [Spirochaetales bacterium]
MENGEVVTTEDGTPFLKPGVILSDLLDGPDVTRLIVKAKDPDDSIMVYFREVISRSVTTVTQGTSLVGSYVNEEYNDRLAIDPTPGIIFVMSGTPRDEYTFRFVANKDEDTGTSWRIKNDGTTQTWELKSGNVKAANGFFWASIILYSLGGGLGAYAVADMVVPSDEPMKDLYSPYRYPDMTEEEFDAAFEEEYATWEDVWAARQQLLWIGTAAGILAGVGCTIGQVVVSPRAIQVKIKV